VTRADGRLGTSAEAGEAGEVQGEIPLVQHDNSAIFAVRVGPDAEVERAVTDVADGDIAPNQEPAADVACFGGAHSIPLT
jgi:hypothetical protein